MQTAYSANEWRQGTGSNDILGTESPSDIDDISYENIVAPLDRILSNYRNGCYGYYLTAATFAVSVGEVVCSNSAGTVRKFRANTSATTVTWSNIDTGSEASSTHYYYYAVADADATTFTVTISTSASAPTGATYYKKLGGFYNNASGDIEMGGIIEMYSGHVNNIPPGYVLCDGNNGTPDLRDHFIFGAGNLCDSGDSKDYSSFHLSGTGDSVTYVSSGGGGLGPGTQALVYSTSDHIPPYYALAFIQRQGVE